MTTPAGTNPPLNGSNVLVVITGASRGIGRELALQLGKRFASTQAHFFLMARNREALEEVQKEIQKSSPKTNVDIFPSDLSRQPFDAKEIVEKIQALEAAAKFDVCLIIHNAGSLGDLTKKSSELTDESQWHEYLQTNLVSTIMLNNGIFAAINNDKEKRIFLVNITSLLSVIAYPSFTQYSVGKAAREAYFRAFAAEHPKCRVLNYAPGPVDTQMHTEVCEKTYDSGVREVFSTKRHDSNLHRKLLTPEQTVQRLIRILEENKFENGARVDYFDK